MKASNLIQEGLTLPLYSCAPRSAINRQRNTKGCGDFAVAKSIQLKVDVYANSLRKHKERLNQS